MFDDILPIGYIEVDGLRSYFMQVGDRYVGMHAVNISGFGYATLTISNGTSEKFDGIIPVDVRIHKGQLESLCKNLGFFSDDITAVEITVSPERDVFLELFRELVEKHRITYSGNLRN